MKGTVLVFALILLVAVAHADPRQWNHAGIPIRHGNQLSWQRTVASRADGTSLVVWSDCRAGNPRIIAQTIDASGTPLWANGGVVVASLAGDNDFPAACATNGGWVIAWMRSSFAVNTPAECGEQVWAQKLGENGGAVWGAGGVPVDTSCQYSIGENIGVSDDGDGGAIIAWSLVTAGYDENVLAQHLNSAGLHDWPGTLAVTNNNYTFLGATDGDGHGNMLVGLEEHPVEYQEYDIYVAKITPEGVMPWGTGVNGVPVCTLPGMQTNPRVRSDGHDGCYVGWQGVDEHPFMQRLDPTGAPMWQADGIVLCTAENWQGLAGFVRSENGDSTNGCIAVWEDGRVNGDVREIYAQKISLQGVVQWAANGVKLCGDASGEPGMPSGHDRALYDFTSDHAGGLICLWEDTRNSDGAFDYCDVYAGRMLADGTPAWNGTDGAVVAEGPLAQNYPVLAGSDITGVLAVFHNSVVDSSSLRIQKLAFASGARLLPDSGRTVVSNLTGSGSYPTAIALNNGRVACVWQDNRANGLWYQIVQNAGQIERAINGTALFTDSAGTTCGGPTCFKSCADGSGGFFTVWQQECDDQYQCYLAHVNSAGDLVTPVSGSFIYGMGNTTVLRQCLGCAPDGSGGCFVSWTDWNTSVGVLVQRVAADGSTIWPQPVSLANVQDQVQIQGTVSDSDGTAFVLWTAYAYASHTTSLHLAKILSNSAVPQNGRVCDAQVSVYGLGLAADGEGGAFIVWTDYRAGGNSSHGQIFAQHFTPDGLEAWGHNGVAVIEDTVAANCAMTLNSSGNLFVSWGEEHSSGGSLAWDLYVQKMSPLGQRMWADDGVVVSNGPEDQYDDVLLPDANNGVFLVWEDGSDTPSCRIAATHLDANGNPTGDNYWEPSRGGSLIDPTADQQRTPSIASDGAGGFVAFFTQGNALGCDITAQHISDVLRADHPSAPEPRVYALSQNYPNPFNPTTQISFALPKAGKTTLKVYDLLGREVTTLMDRVMPAGNHTATFDASHLASGIYFYRIESGVFRATKKMMLLK